MIGSGLSRREREVVEALHRLGTATALEVKEAMQSPPSYSAVRSILRILEEKGHVTHFEDGKRYVYKTLGSRRSAGREALKDVVNTFFEGSLSAVVRSFLDAKGARLDEAELRELEALIEQAREEQQGNL